MKTTLPTRGLAPLLVLAVAVGGLGGPAARAETVCDPIPGAAEVLRPGTTILLGELHGTAEGPPIVARLTCEALAMGLDVTVGLELPRSHQGALEEFLSGAAKPRSRGSAFGPSPHLSRSGPFHGRAPGPGGADDRRRLLEGEPWRRPYQDGRTSAAMLALHDRLRSLSAGAGEPEAGEPETGEPEAGELETGELEVLYLDDPSHPAGRDRAMAERLLRARERAPGRLFVVLTGNLHNRLTRGTSWDEEYEPMGLHLARALPEEALVSLELTHAGGGAWVCQGGAPEDCGVVRVSGREALGAGVVLHAAASGVPVDGEIHLGPITASPPAVEAVASLSEG